MFADRQVLFVRGARDRAVDACKFPAIGLVPGPDLWRSVGVFSFIAVSFIRKMLETGLAWCLLKRTAQDSAVVSRSETQRYYAG